MLPELRECPQCLELAPFDAPPCLDGHGEQCPDLACGACGAALVAAIAVIGPQHRKTIGRARRATSRRRAA